VPDPENDNRQETHLHAFRSFKRALRQRRAANEVRTARVHGRPRRTRACAYSDCQQNNGMGEYKTYDGEISYSLYGSIHAGDDIYAVETAERPFPKPVKDGFFRALDLIQWIDEEIAIWRKNIERMEVPL
jgi:hypothetical protein